MLNKSVSWRLVMEDYTWMGERRRETVIWVLEKEQQEEE